MIADLLHHSLISHALVVVCACIVDFFVGDPLFIPHPVVFMGKLIKRAERIFRKIFPRTHTGELIAGFFLWLFVCTVSVLFPLIIIYFLSKISLLLAFAVKIFLAEQCLAARCLDKEAMGVFCALQRGLAEGRRAVSRIVGRDTQRLDETGVIRACVETVAENTTDGVISPLFFLSIFGIGGAFFYKAVNTMDSMIAYKNSTYLYFGRCAAKADDVANFLPARIASLLMICASFFLRLNYKNALRIFLRDRKKHASPNSAQTESVCAGALGVRLAGNAYYEGKLEEKEYIGDELCAIEKDDIKKSLRLMWFTYALFLFAFLAVIFSTLSPK